MEIALSAAHNAAHKRRKSRGEEGQGRYQEKVQTLSGLQLGTPSPDNRSPQGFRASFRAYTPVSPEASRAICQGGRAIPRRKDFDQPGARP